jgi:hypothetical protein
MIKLMFDWTISKRAWWFWFIFDVIMYLVNGLTGLFTQDFDFFFYLSLLANTIGMCLLMFCLLTKRVRE